jgi:hypothetical protein
MWGCVYSLYFCVPPTTNDLLYCNSTVPLSHPGKTNPIQADSWDTTTVPALSHPSQGNLGFWSAVQPGNSTEK